MKYWIITLHFQITNHNEPKLYLELSNIQQEAEKYKYEYHISTPTNYATTAEKFLQNSNFNIEKKKILPEEYVIQLLLMKSRKYLIGLKKILRRLRKLMKVMT
ncbi:hypothetical protein N7281_02845 [Rickettsia hoogstraalii]|uniref:hypothetical protein n=1 Tax=Rickettsia hoogstraalii TaxID=467174 RepID=UPI002251D261|nr:hypothetical protein [Rickettsia hoogstraalii]MCX4083813.1 hypothetical protein [Rickettsia hoogstraalii]